MMLLQIRVHLVIGRRDVTLVLTMINASRVLVQKKLWMEDAYVKSITVKVAPLNLFVRDVKMDIIKSLVILHNVLNVVFGFVKFVMIKHTKGYVENVSQVINSTMKKLHANAGLLVAKFVLMKLQNVQPVKKVII